MLQHDREFHLANLLGAQRVEITRCDTSLSCLHLPGRLRTGVAENAQSLPNLPQRES